MEERCRRRQRRRRRQRGMLQPNCVRRMAMVRKINGEMAQAKLEPRTKFIAESCGVSPDALAREQKKKQSYENVSGQAQRLNFIGFGQLQKLLDRDQRHGSRHCGHDRHRRAQNQQHDYGDQDQRRSRCASACDEFTWGPLRVRGGRANRHALNRDDLIRRSGARVFDIRQCLRGR